MLYANVPVFTDEHARGIVASYEARWRVEEFHRTWKQNQCNVEDAQLHSERVVIVWTTILSSVATRIERSKYLSPKTPDAPATIELSEEIEALKLDQRRHWTKRRRLPDVPTIGVATGWLAELGGWLDERNGPSGSITLAPGLSADGQKANSSARCACLSARAGLVGAALHTLSGPSAELCDSFCRAADHY